LLESSLTYYAGNINGCPGDVRDLWGVVKDAKGKNGFKKHFYFNLSIEKKVFLIYNDVDIIFLGGCLYGSQLC
jgi:hypothetical protein